MDPITPRATRARPQDPNNTPQRRSLYDLQKLIDEVFDGGFANNDDNHNDDGTTSRTCRAADLPAILTAFEERRNVMLLDEDEMGMLRAFTEEHPDLDVSSEQLVSLLSAMTAESKPDPSSPTRVYDKQLPTPPSSEAEEHEGRDNNSNALSPEVSTSTSRSRTSSNSSSSSSSHNSTMLTGSGTLEDTTSLTSPSLFDVDPIFPRSQSMPDGALLQQLIPSPPGTPIPHQRSHTIGDLARVAAGHSGHGEISSIPRPISSLQHARSKTGGVQSVTTTTPLSAAIAANRQRSSPLVVDVQGEHALRRSRPAPPKSRRISGDKFGSNSNLSSLPSSSSTGSIASLDASNGRRSRQSSNEEVMMLGGLVSPRMMSPNEGMTSPLFATSLDSMHEEGGEGDSSFGDDVYSTHYNQNRSRQSSYGTRGASPLFETSPPPPHQYAQQASIQGAMFPPQSPLLDDTSFHTIPISPHDLKQAMDDFKSDDLDNNDDDNQHIVHTRPVSTVSTLGGSSSSEVTALQETIQHLQQELSRKTTILESQRNDNYSILMEKELLIDELKFELSCKRKEEKELRNKEKFYTNQINILEVQTAGFRDERDKQKLAYQNARKQYEEQCSESEKLRNIVRSKEEDLQLADENLQSANSDLAKITRERDYLQVQVTRLEEELTEARNSIELLEESKNENLQLKETIDRLRLDLDELRAQARIHAENSAASNGNKAGGSALSRSTSGTESIPPTLSRNLGRELARRFAGDGNHDEEIDVKEERKDSEEAEDGYEEEEIVTTRRRLKRPIAKKSESIALGTDNVPSPSTQEYLSLEVCDVQIQVSPPEIPTNEQSTQTEKERVLSIEEKRAALAQDLAVNLDAVEEYIRAKEERAKVTAAEPDTAPPPYQSGPPSANRHGIFQPYTTVLSREAKSLLDLALQSSGSLLAYTLIVFLSGILTGSTLAPVRHHHHIASVDSYANWAAYNTLDLGQVGNGAGWKENAWFVIERVIWKGVAISRRVPT